LPLAPVTQPAAHFLALVARARRQRAKKQNRQQHDGRPPALARVLMSRPAGDAKWRKVASWRRRVNQPDHYPN